jgi:translation initiation factor 2B subunit (eIF-2B alpha/beta/delta family)
MANGGVIAPVGMNMLALAAQRHAVPFVVVAGSHKVIPYHAYNMILFSFFEHIKCIHLNLGNMACRIKFVVHQGFIKFLL